jgi:hypothetical protein
VVVTNYDNVQTLPATVGLRRGGVRRTDAPEEPVRQAVQGVAEGDRPHPDPLGADRVVYQQRSGGRVRPVQGDRPDVAGAQQRRVPATVLLLREPGLRGVEPLPGSLEKVMERIHPATFVLGAGRVRRQAAAAAHRRDALRLGRPHGLRGHEAGLHGAVPDGRRRSPPARAW